MSVRKQSKEIQKALIEERLVSIAPLTDERAARIAEICCKCLFSAPEKNEIAAVHNYWRQFLGDSLSCKRFLANIIRICANRHLLALSIDSLVDLDREGQFNCDMMLQGALPASWKAFAVDEQRLPVHVRALMYTGPFAGLELDLLIRKPWLVLKALRLPKRKHASLVSIVKMMVRGSVFKTGVRKGEELAVITGNLNDVYVTPSMQQQNRHLLAMRETFICPEKKSLSLCPCCSKTSDQCAGSPRVG